MAQPFTKEDQLGVALLTQNMLEGEQPVNKKFAHVLQEVDWVPVTIMDLLIRSLQFRQFITH